jgi:hypothetical protein
MERAMGRVVLKFGLIAGAVLATAMLGSMPFQQQIGFEYGMLIGYTSMVLAFLAVYFGVHYYRDTAGGGAITFSRAFGVGMLIVLVATVCYVLTWELIFFKLAPEYGDRMAEYSMQQMQEKGGTPAELAAQQRELEAFMVSYRNPLVNMAWTFIEPLPVGVVIALFVAWRQSRTGARAENGGTAIA